MNDVFYLNDTQVGSLTERPDLLLKALDHFYYDYPAPAGILGNGDYQHGWNYPSFPNESRHLGTMSMSQQMVDFVKLVKPWIKQSFGVINPNIFKGEYEDCKIDDSTCADIIVHLRAIDAIKSGQGDFNNIDLVKEGVDYRTIDLKLPPKLRPYESIIREKLSGVRSFKFIHTTEGNHEYNSDWDKKGTNMTKLLNLELENMKHLTGSDIEIVHNEFLVNKKGDIFQAPHGCKTINGYNIAYAHSYKAAKGESPTTGMAKFFDNMGELSNDVHRAVMGHLHIFETAVIDNKQYTITGSSAGQSGFEQNLGLCSSPLFVIDRYLPDGRIVQDFIGPEFLKNYQIQNPEIRAIGLGNFIDQVMTEEVGVYAFDGKPEDVQEVHQRKLVIASPNKIIGPKID